MLSERKRLVRFLSAFVLNSVQKVYIAWQGEEATCLFRHSAILCRLVEGVNELLL